MALKKLQAQTDTTKPFLENKKYIEQYSTDNSVNNKKKKNKNYIVGYLRGGALSDINSIILDEIKHENLDLNINLSQLIYVVTEFKQKRLNTNKVFLDMGEEILPISQIPLLSSNLIKDDGIKERYFYLYYKDDSKEEQNVEAKDVLQGGLKDESQDESEGEHNNDCNDKNVDVLSEKTQIIKEAIKKYLMSKCINKSK
jgi:hypothetical protein